MDTPQDYLREHFQDLLLEPALFYSWRNSIRFEISDPKIAYDDPTVMRQAFQRSLTLFHEVIRPGDELFLVTDVRTKVGNRFLHKKPLNVYRKYIKQRPVLYKLQLQESEDLEEEVKVYRFWLRCQKTDIWYSQLLKAICYEDIGHSSQILKSYPASGYEIYVINRSRNLIFHLYDDRGCDVLAACKDDLRDLYEK